MNDPYLDLIDEQWSNIAMIYDTFRNKKPILEYEVDGKKIFSYPAIDYINDLTERTRNRTEKQYEDACNNNQFLLFIKDKRNKKLRSYIFDIPDKVCENENIGLGRQFKDQETFGPKK
jgi:hypothetical protein